MPQKENNQRKFPMANHQPFHKASMRKAEAHERQTEYDKLSIEEKLKLLDEKLGVGVGAKKQRARLQALLEKKVRGPKEEPKATVEDLKQEKSPKKSK